MHLQFSFITLLFTGLIGFSGIKEVSGHGSVSGNGEMILIPANGETGVNPDTRLKIIFKGIPVLGNKGMIRVYDASDDSLVDILDLSIPPGPKNSRTPAPYQQIDYEAEQKYLAENNTDVVKTFIQVPRDDIYQHNYIGGDLESDIYHFYPVLIHDTVASICLHNHRLKYDRTYYVEVDPNVFTVETDSFKGISGNRSWRFTTKQRPPSGDKDLYIVSSDGSGDFSTVLGAIEFIPANNPGRKTIFIKNGTYEEIVYFRNKENITIAGEERDQVVICYANNGIFNARPTGPRDEMIERFRNRRTVFAVDHSNDIQLANFTVQSLGEKPAQAEGLLVIGERIIVDHVTIIGSGDALQATGSIYITHSSITGLGDNILGYGAVFFNECDLISTYGPHMWVRNTNENHGNIFLNCTFSTIGDVETVIARAPSSPYYSFPYVEAVLINCAMEGIRPEGWGQVGEQKKHIRYWEFNSVNLEDGAPVDVSRRAPYSRQLSMEEDSAIIASYSDPSFILKGWTPVVTPLNLSPRLY